MIPFPRERTVIPATGPRGDSNPPATKVVDGGNNLDEFTLASTHNTLSHPLQLPAGYPSPWYPNPNLYGEYSNTHDAVRQRAYPMGEHGYSLHVHPQHVQAPHGNMNVTGRIEEYRIQQNAFEPELETEPESNPEPSSIPVPPNVSKICEWRGCRNTRPFKRAADLVRHLKSVHISPDAYPCREPGCGKVFGRLDNLTAHRQRAHE